MKHVKALLIKFAASLLLLYVVLGIMYEMTFGEVFLLSAVLGLLAYLIGDLLILPRTNNIIGTVADFGLSLLIIYWFTDAVTIADNPFIPSLIAALGVSLFEMFFHRYMANNVLPDNPPDTITRNLQYQTETSEELMEEVMDGDDEEK